MLFEIDIWEMFLVEALAGFSPNGLRDKAKRFRYC